MACGVCLRF